MSTIFNVAAYETMWNELSWHIQDTILAFSGMLGWNEWDKIRHENIQKTGKVFYTDYSLVAGVISKALYIQYFLLICRIYDKNSKISLSNLYAGALKLNLLSDQEIHVRCSELNSSIESFYSRLCKVRDKVIAHYDIKTTAYNLLNEEAITRANVLSYLDECEELFHMLGKPLNKNVSRKKMEYNADLINQMKNIHSLLAPI